MCVVMSFVPAVNMKSTLRALNHTHIQFTVALNVFQIMTMTAFRMMAILRRIAYHPAHRMHTRTAHNQPYLVKIISEGVEYFHSIVAKRFQSVNQAEVVVQTAAEPDHTKFRRSNSGARSAVPASGRSKSGPSQAQQAYPEARLGISKVQTTYFSYIAFQTAFQRKQTLYPEVCRELEALLDHQQLAMVTRTHSHTPSPSSTASKSTRAELAEMRAGLREAKQILPRILSHATTRSLYSIKY